MSMEKPRRRGLVAAIIALALVALVGAIGFRYLFNRPGEAAVQYIPKEAYAVITLDTNPSPAQVAAFAKFRQAISKHGLDKALESALSGAFNQLPLPSQLRPQLKDNFALTVFNTREGGNPDFVFLCDVEDPGKVASILAAQTTAKPEGGLKIYSFDKSPMYLAVIREYLVIGSSVDALLAIKAVADGRRPSLAGDPSYEEARRSLPSDANLMIVATERLIKEMAATVPVDPITRQIKWYAISGTLSDEGLAIDFRMPVPASLSPLMAAFAKAGPVDAAEIARLPAGAYMFGAWENTGASFEYLLETTKVEAGSPANGPDPKLLDDYDPEFERLWAESLVIAASVADDLRGKATFALYPGPQGATKGLDMLAIIDDSKGGKPEKLIALIAERFSPKLKFAPTRIADASAFALENASLKQVHMMLGAPKESLDFLKSNTIAYAVIDGDLIAASSKEMLERAIRARRDGEDTMTSAEVATAVKRAVDQGSQAFGMFAVGRLLKELEPMLRMPLESDPSGKQVADRIFGDYSMTDAIVGRYKYDGRIVEGTLILPLNASAVAIPAAILYPVFAQARAAAKEASTTSNLKQLALATIMYGKDNDDEFPDVSDWSAFREAVLPYSKNEAVFATPNPNGGKILFNKNLAGLMLCEMEYPEDTPMLWEASAWPDGKRGVAYTDGSVERLNAADWKVIQTYMKP